MSSGNSDIFDRDRFRANLLNYTREAFSLLSPPDNPLILDIGCGSGTATLEVARLSGGRIVAFDIDRQALNVLIKRAANEGLSSRVMAVHSSMLEMAFRPNSFDIIWTEGAISAIGFERGLREWRSLLVRDGYLVVHDVLSGLQSKIELAHTCGYTILGKFELLPEVWWNEYYKPLKRQLEMLGRETIPDRLVAKEMAIAARELEEFDMKDDRFGSVFFILGKV